MNTPNKCPKCDAEISESHSPEEGRIFRCGSSDDFTSALCKERAAHAGTKRELEAANNCLGMQRRAFADFIAAAQDACKWCNGAGQDNDGEAFTGEPCPDCQWIGRSIPDFMLPIPPKDGASCNKSELETLRARVRELEGLPLGNEDRRDGGIWVEVFIPTERLGGANCEGEECPTLGDAMPEKDK